VRRVLEKYLLLQVALFMAILSAFGQNSGAPTEVDPGVAVGIELNHRVRLDLYTGREKSDELDSSKWKIGGGVSLRTKPLFKNFIDHFDADKQHVLVAAVMYEYSKASDAEIRSIEHKLMLDATGRYAFGGKILISDRNRFEFRWVDGDSRFRYRNRLFVERPWKAWKIKKREITTYGGAEAFWDQKFTKWNQFRFTAGVQFPIPALKRTSIDLYCERAHCVTCSNPNVNVFGASIYIFFSNRK